MKVVLAVLAVADAANAAPATLIGGAAIPIDGGYPYTDALGFDIPKALPVSPLTYSHISPLTYSHLPPPITYSVGTAVHPGYVAKTPGATHIAPLPAGIGYASHHINLADAPGTE